MDSNLITVLGYRIEDKANKWHINGLFVFKDADEKSFFESKITTEIEKKIKG